MFVRIRWFFLGVLSAIGGGAYLVARVRRMRARITGANVRRAARLAVADGLDAAGRVISPGDAGQARD